MDSQPEPASDTELSPAKIKTSERISHLWILISIFCVLFLLLAVPNFIRAREKARAAATKGNMRAIQIAIENYATDSGGYYPDHFRNLLPYIPNGENSNSWENVLDVGPLERKQFDSMYGNKSFKSGQIIFSGIRTQGQKECDGYAIMAAAENGQPNLGGKPLVLSNY